MPIQLKPLLWLKMLPKFNDGREIVYDFCAVSTQSYITALNTNNLNPLSCKLMLARVYTPIHVSVAQKEDYWYPSQPPCSALPDIL
jgi:hypothetical protein